MATRHNPSHSPEERAAIGDGMRRNWAKRNAIMDAILSGDAELAMRLSEEYKNRFRTADGTFDARRCQSIRRDMYDTDAEYEAALESAAASARRYHITNSAPVTDQEARQAGRNLLDALSSDDEVAEKFRGQILNQLRKDRQ